jgi:hypothetical protein
VKYQYYYKTNDCKALHATDAECICWHDEGTGPFPGHRIGVHTCHWRDKPEANKMVSDTPRTDAAIWNSQDRSWMDGTLCRQIERELNEANERIKRLEGELESTKADRDSWSNQSDEFAKTAADLIIRIKRLEDGDAALTYSIGLDLQKENEVLKARIKRLEDAGDALKASGYFGGFGDAVNKWINVREDNL